MRVCHFIILAALLLGAASALVVGCGDDDDDDSTVIAPDDDDAADDDADDDTNSNDDDDDDDEVPPTICEGSYGPPEASKRIADKELREASGLAGSPINPDVVWTHNDSGDSARLFAINVDGTVLGRLNVEGAQSGDWEDCAAGTCPDGSGSCLWVEDHGHTLYAVVEPVVSAVAPFGEATTTDYWTFQTLYPSGGGPDVEALLVAPDGSTFYYIEKTTGDRARIFSGVPPPERVADIELTEVGTVACPGPIGVARDITGGDFHPSMTRIVLRTYLGVFEYRLKPGDFPGNLDAAERLDIMVSLKLEPSGEAVTYDQSGTGLLTLSEGFLQIPGQPIYHFPCVR